MLAGLYHRKGSSTTQSWCTRRDGSISTDRSLLTRLCSSPRPAQGALAHVPAWIEVALAQNHIAP